MAHLMRKEMPTVSMRWCRDRQPVRTAIEPVLQPVLGIGIDVVTGPVVSEHCNLTVEVRLHVDPSIPCSFPRLIHQIGPPSSARFRPGDLQLHPSENFTS